MLYRILGGVTLLAMIGSGLILAGIGEWLIRAGFQDIRGTDLYVVHSVQRPDAAMLFFLLAAVFCAILSFQQPGVRSIALWTGAASFLILATGTKQTAAS